MRGRQDDTNNSYYCGPVSVKINQRLLNILLLQEEEEEEEGRAGYQLSVMREEEGGWLSGLNIPPLDRSLAGCEDKM